MNDCQFCADKPIIINETPVWLIGIPAMTALFKYSVTVPIPNISDFTNDKRFTPEARLTLDSKSAEQMLAHRIAWLGFVKTGAHHGAIFDSPSAFRPNLIKTLETTQFPRDWDIILVSDTQYILTQRAASILLVSTPQFHDSLTTLLKTHPMLKTVNASPQENSTPINE